MVQLFPILSAVLLAVASIPYRGWIQYLKSYCRKMGMFLSLFEVFNYLEYPKSEIHPSLAPYGFNISFDKMIIYYYKERIDSNNA
jgi:hypothetical protein